MGRMVPVSLWAVGVGCMVVLLASHTYADEPEAAKPNENKPQPMLDCRFDHGHVGEASEAFPSDDVFRPLIADPKQPQFFAMWQHARPRNGESSFNLGSVAIGENFGFYTKRTGCDGWQVGLLTGIFSQFNLDQKNAELINTDFNVGLPLSWRSGNWSARLRYYHQSSHLGDEFLIRNVGFRRFTVSFEEVDAILSYDYKWLRLYGGAAYLVHTEPSTIDRTRLQWGFEARAPAMRTSILVPFLDRLLITPVLSADFKSAEEHSWIIDTNVLGGFEWSRTGSRRRFRIMATYFHGYNPYGQFFINQKIESIGLGAYFTF
ncbi:MAG: DUF1207 domain-containing protein [Nitrospira sp.]|nr:DUF1207 domain-containing protein [Nitrospira sp.]MBH0182059.1 DUF1207 domain-containing protein [Nitrospira sp.]MBH0185269.1 DUF1207 domain-containing protein [Nitrospira sp.]